MAGRDERVHRPASGTWARDGNRTLSDTHRPARSCIRSLDIGVVVHVEVRPFGESW